MLILSNFSFASHLMLCGMSEDVKVCECNHDNANTNDGVNLSKAKSKCCSDEITVLSNSNLLLIVKVEILKNINSFAVITLNLNQSSLLLNNPKFIFAIDKSHLPILDISIITSSLLI